MTVQEARELLLANACCNLSLCDKCPYDNTKKCEDESFEYDNLSEAIEIIMEEIQNEKAI